MIHRFILKILVSTIPFSCALTTPNASASSELKFYSILWQDNSNNKLNILRKDHLKNLSKIMSQDKETDKLLALFSYGGWSDVGQRVFFLEPNHNLLKYYFAKPNSSKFESQQKTKIQELNFFEIIEKTQDLDNYDSKAFDGIQYEIIIAEHNESTWKIVKRIQMNNPEIGKDGKAHNELIKNIINISKKIETKK